ncbi:unnamed protein product, partial [Prorocentrum cordatum]
TSWRRSCGCRSCVSHWRRASRDRCAASLTSTCCSWRAVTRGGRRPQGPCRSWPTRTSRTCSEPSSPSCGPSSASTPPERVPTPLRSGRPRPQ